VLFLGFPGIMDRIVVGDGNTNPAEPEISALTVVCNVAVT
jgi:hypothetical protein